MGERLTSFVNVLLISLVQCVYILTVLLLPPITLHRVHTRHRCSIDAAKYSLVKIMRKISFLLQLFNTTVSSHSPV